MIIRFSYTYYNNVFLNELLKLGFLFSAAPYNGTFYCMDRVDGSALDRDENGGIVFLSLNDQFLYCAVRVHKYFTGY